ncbi:MAG: hypothetical protein MH204_04850, partial [Fimbriimonadaceae bacterium]|nr:hypothetical protein [Fimbriimonadaceae bacterium]
GATSVTDFWRKWHISLSSWFREFVYIPLGGNRGGKWMGIRNMWVTMLVSGVWHGAAWTFVIWAALHATYLTIERLTNWPEKLSKMRYGTQMCAVIVFILVLIAWVFFRANSSRQAFAIVATMMNPTKFSLAELAMIDLSSWFFLALGLAMVLNSAYGWSRKLHERLSWLPPMRPIWIGLLAVVVLFWRGPGGAFIYFQF